MSRPWGLEMSSVVSRVSIVGGTGGEWRVEWMNATRGDALPATSTITRIEGEAFAEPADARWVLRGVRSHERYTERVEKDRLVMIQEGLGRPDSVLAALIPIRKSDAWWALPQDERRAIFEARSRHIAIGARHLPAIARRLYHGRDLGEPFDFLTWFEFAEPYAAAFDDLVGTLRETEEWRYVAREVEIRLRRA
jgi:chlorite dismutase